VRHATLAVQAAGRTVDVQLLPDSDEPDLLARLEIGGPSPVDPQIAALVAAMPHRHTQRDRFSAEPLPDSLLDELSRVAELRGAQLFAVTDSDHRLWLSVLLSRADALESSDPAYRAEIAEWTRADRTVDGVPASAAPDDPASTRASDLALRDFRAAGSVQAADGPAIHQDDEPAPPTPEHPFVAILSTRGDGVSDWLAAGQALAEVLLAATAAGVGSSPLGQVGDWPGPRAELRRELAVQGWPQLALRMGFGPEAPATPRRPVSEVLRP
jgi:hypothetical protein